MQTNLRGKIRDFMQSEEGKVALKAPLAIGVATGGVLLAHAIVGTPSAEAWCVNDEQCARWEVCDTGTCRPG